MAKINDQARKKQYQNLAKKLAEGKVLSSAQMETFETLADEFSPDESPEKNERHGKIIVTNTQLCRLFVCSKMAISDWVKRGAPRLTYGKYDFEAFFRWWQTNINQNQTRKTLEGKERYWSAKADAEEIKVLNLTKETVPVREVKKWVASQVQKMKSKFLGLPAAIAGSLEGVPWHEIQQRLDREVRRILEEIGDTFSIGASSRKRKTTKAA